MDELIYILLGLTSVVGWRSSSNADCIALEQSCAAGNRRRAGKMPDAKCIEKFISRVRTKTVASRTIAHARVRRLIGRKWTMWTLQTAARHEIVRLERASGFGNHRGIARCLDWSEQLRAMMTVFGDVGKRLNDAAQLHGYRVDFARDAHRTISWRAAVCNVSTLSTFGQSNRSDASMSNRPRATFLFARAI